MENREEIIAQIHNYYDSVASLSSYLSQKEKDISPVFIQAGRIVELLARLYPNFGQSGTLRTWEKIFTVKPYLFSIKDKVSSLIQKRNQAAHASTKDALLDKTELTNLLTTLKSIIDLAIKDTEPKNIPNLYINSSDFAFDYALKYIFISQYQSIQKIEEVFPLDAQFIVFLGDNGGGKTSILQAIAIGLQGNFDPNSGLRLSNDPNFWIETHFKNQTHIHSNTFVLENSLNPENALHCFSTYSASRLQIQSPESMENQKNTRGAAYAIFRTDAILLNIEHWLKNKILEGKEDHVLHILNIFIAMLPHIDRIERKGSQFFYYEGNFAVPIDHLSAGHKSIVAMIGDMIIRLAEAQPEISDPKEFGGIVLIDELEAHLHPKWQREFPKILSETFPKVQFIVTTHSAICLLGMPKNSAFYKVQRTENEGTTVDRIEIDLANLTPEHILTSPLFGMDSVLSVRNQDIYEIPTGIKYQNQQELAEQEARRQAILEKYKSL